MQLWQVGEPQMKRLHLRSNHIPRYASHASWITGGHHITPTQTIRKKKANQQKVHHAFALFDPNWLKADLVIQDLTMFCFFGFPCWVQNGWHNAGGRGGFWKKNVLHTCINFQKLKTKNPGTTAHSKHQQHQATMSPDPASESIGPINQWVSFFPSFRRFRGLLKAGALAKRNDSSNSWGDVSGKFNDSMDVKAKSKPVHKRSDFKKRWND